MAKATAPSDLVRESLVKQLDPITVSDTIKNLATKSASILGYEVVHHIVHRPMTLREVLVTLNIHPFSKRSVELYKSKMMKKAIKGLTKEQKEEGLEVRWRTTNINRYNEPVPESVLLKAIQIKEVLPTVEFSIEQLTIAKPDPFLIATFDRERYYIEVWDEPMFEDAILRGVQIKNESDFDSDDD